MKLTSIQCRKIKKIGDLMIREPIIETRINDGRNYNGTRLAKFLNG